MTVDKLDFVFAGRQEIRPVVLVSEASSRFRVSSEVADQVREDLLPLEDEQQLRISLTALTPKELAALPDDDRWWSDVVRDARILKGSAPEVAKRQVARATA